MRIAILGDTHSRSEIVNQALRMIEANKITLIIHLGDIEDAQTVHLFDGYTTHFVFGNCDWDKPALRRAMHESGATLHEPFGKLELEGVKIAWTHGDDKRLLRDLEHRESFDFLFYGHTHHAEQHQSGQTRVINPGALHRARPKTFVLLDLAGKSIERLVIDETA